MSECPQPATAKVVCVLGAKSCQFVSSIQSWPARVPWTCNCEVVCVFAGSTVMSICKFYSIMTCPSALCLRLQGGLFVCLVGWLCWGLTSQSTIFQSCRDRAIASWVINQYFRGVKCLAQGHNTAEVGLEPRTSRSGVRHSTTEPPRSPVCLFVLRLNVPVNNFSVMSGWSHRFLGN